MMPAMVVRAMVVLSGLLATLGLLLGLSSTALASPSYSGVVKRTFDMECAPSCLLCHTRATGGFATANTKLGITLRRGYDAECCEDELLGSILEQLEADAIDSDGDGASDAAELRAFRDPNLADTSAAPGALTCQPVEADGCALREGGAAGRPRLVWSSVFLLVLGAWCVRRYRQKL